MANAKHLSSAKNINTLQTPIYTAKPNSAFPQIIKIKASRKNQGQQQLVFNILLLQVNDIGNFPLMCVSEIMSLHLCSILLLSASM